MKEKGKLKDYTKMIFGRRFSELLEERFEGTLTDFAGEMNKLYEEYEIMNRRKDEFRECTFQQVSDWKNGKKLPDEDNLRCISEILNTEPSYFTYTFFDTGLSPDSPYVLEQDRKFIEKIELLGIRPEFLEFIRSDDLFSIKFPFDPNDRKKQVIDEENTPKLKKYARVEEKGSLWDIDMSKDMLFILELQEEVRKTIDRMYWDRFEKLRQANIKFFSKILSKMWKVDPEVITQQYINNPDWFIRTKISLSEQMKEDQRALGDLIWNYAIDHKIERVFEPFEPEFSEIDPEIAELNRLRHEDPDELERIAREQEEKSTKEANEQYEDLTRWINEGIQNGTLKKKERRK